MTTRISLVLGKDRHNGVRRAVELLQTNSIRGKPVVLKPNFNSADICPGSTHNDTLRALVTCIKEMGAMSITLAERSGPGAPTRQVMEQKGIFDLSAELGFKVVNLEEAGPEAYVHFKPDDSHWENGFLFPRIYREAQCVVSTCCLKTHQFGGHFTMSLKLAVGLVPRVGHGYMQELHSSPYQRQLIAEINTAYSPELIVLDGVDAFVDGGPHKGTRVEAGVMLAGSDRIAVDAVGVAILRLLGTTPEVTRGPVFGQDQISRAVQLGLGIKSPAEIELVTGDTESEAYARRVKEILMKP